MSRTNEYLRPRNLLRDSVYNLFPSRNWIFTRVGYLVVLKTPSREVRPAISRRGEVIHLACPYRKALPRKGLRYLTTERKP